VACCASALPGRAVGPARAVLGRGRGAALDRRKEKEQGKKERKKRGNGKREKRNEEKENKKGKNRKREGKEV
jgi:hypothetical protein